MPFGVCGAKWFSDKGLRRDMDQFCFSSKYFSRKAISSQEKNLRGCRKCISDMTCVPTYILDKPSKLYVPLPTYSSIVQIRAWSYTAFKT